jgi:hypothetical protein
MDPNSQEYMDLYAYVASLTPQVKKAMLKWEKERKALMKKLSAAPAGPCAPRGPCAPAGPCAPKKR